MLSRMAFAELLILTISSVAVAKPSAETLRGYLTKSDVCLSGTFSLVVGESSEAGVVRYYCELEVGQVIAGQCSAKKISVGIVRLEPKREEAPPFLKEGEKCILFLKRTSSQDDTRFTLANAKFGLQEYSEELVRAIGNAQENRGTDSKTTKDRPADPVPSTDLAGLWLLTMPAGFEYEARLERIENGPKYRLVAGAANLRGFYELQGGRLSMIEPENERMTGLVWEIKNKNVVLLVEHPEQSQHSSDYRNATLSRPASK